MASTYAIQDTINYSLWFISQLALVNTNNEPARTIANLILNTFYSPPFVWEHNRTTATWNCTAGTTDYTVTTISPTFGFVESAYLTVQTGNDQGRIFQLGFQRSLEKASDRDRPSKLSVFQDNGTDVIFRLFNAPDQAYPTVVTYQKQPVLIGSATNLTSTFWPMPDKYIGIVNYGFLALSLLYLNDPRYPEINQKFIASLLAAQQGLDETQVNLFMQTWAQTSAQIAGVSLRATQGTQGRGM